MIGWMGRPAGGGRAALVRARVEGAVLEMVGEVALCLGAEGASQLHADLCMASRSDDGPTRLGALRGLGRLYTVLGDAALMHVPNAVPFVTELVEDGEEDVRAEAAATLKQLEGLAKEEFDVDRERAVARR